MRLGIKGKQVLGVTSIVGVVVVIVSVLHLARLASVSLDESRARADLLAKTIYQRTREVVGTGPDPYAAVKADSGLRSILESSVYSKDVTFAAIADVNQAAVVHADPSLEGQTLPFGGDLSGCSTRRPFAQLLADLFEPGPEPGASRAAAARRPRDRVDPHRRLDAADPPESERLARAGGRDRADRPRSVGAGRDGAGAAAAAPDSRDPQRVDAARQGRVRRPAEPHTSTTSSASSAPPSTRSANSCRRIARRWPGRSRTSSRRSSGSRTPSRSSTRAARCCSRTPRSARSCRRRRPARRSTRCCPPIIRCGGCSSRRWSAGSRAVRSRRRSATAASGS